MKIKVLSIRQPWAWLIVNGYKTIENRTWRVNDRGPILIHAGKSFDYNSLWFMCERRETLAAGRAVLERFGITGDDEPRITKGREIMGALVGFAWLTRTDSAASDEPWAEKGLYHWHMERGREMAVPESMPGRLGLFQYHWNPTAEFRIWRNECAEEFGGEE